ncbi:hypothetical protein, partial [Paraburkholderia unamae]|uniref:hypothetical protein n=1 Tax=Paraburkholderia unamae TaxID=219649 RepID=UPI002096B468
MTTTDPYSLWQRRTGSLSTGMAGFGFETAIHVRLTSVCRSRMSFASRHLIFFERVQPLLVFAIYSPRYAARTFGSSSICLA